MESFSKIILEKRKGYREVFIYYSRNGAKFRESTRVKILNRDIVDFEGTISEATNRESIQKVHRQVEDLILHYIRQYDEKPPVQWLRIEYDKLKVRELLFPQSNALPVEVSRPEMIALEKEDRVSESIESNLFFWWEDFIQMKRQTTRTEGTIKRYGNLLYIVRRFNDVYRDRGYEVIGVNSLNQDFFNDFLNYMIREHEYFHSTAKGGPDAVEYPDIGLSNETIIKRLTDLVEYLNYCKKRKGVPVDIEEILEYIKISKFKFGVIKQCDSKRWELTLTPEELQFVINLDYYEPQYHQTLSKTQKRFLDIFIFMCLQGTAPIDTQKIIETDIVRGKLVGDRRKTRNGFKVELDPIAEQILQKYNYNLTFVDQTLNEAVKKLFVTIFELYRPYFEDKYNEEYQLIYTQRKAKGDTEFLVTQHKGFFVEAMTGRRTFITNLNEETDERGMKENMRRTGHSRMQTHLGYQKDRQTGKNSKRRSLFGVSKIVQSEDNKERVNGRLRKKRKQRIVLDAVIS